MNLLMRILRKHTHNQEGMALLIALILMVVLTAIGITGIYLSTSDMKIAFNYKQSVKKFYTASGALTRGLNALENTPIDQWSSLIADASGDLDPDNPNAFVILKENIGKEDETELRNLGIGHMNYSVWVRNNFDDPSNDPSINGDSILVVLAESGESVGINKRIESAVIWKPIEDDSYGGKNGDSENTGTVEVAIDWGE